MKITYAIFLGSRVVGVNLIAASMKEINDSIAELNAGELKFRAHIQDIKQDKAGV
jgi:hypothetical protein